MSKILRDLAKAFIFRHTRFGAPRYPYLVEPMQLATIIYELERIRDLPGAILEIGVARGMTTRFMCEHLIRMGRTSEPLYAIDTFESFKEDHLKFETAVRGKTRDELAAFAYNDFEIWSKNFKQFPFVMPCKADCATFDYSSIGPIKFAFLDVDLYLPTREALNRIYIELCEGGVILVDDVTTGINWDGAHQAYVEFCSKQGIQTNFLGTKCGLIRKESTTASVSSQLRHEGAPPAA
jgi:hypothetical protein